jgi:sulfoxide reductase heme-binding subunit YedZ
MTVLYLLAADPTGDAAHDTAIYEVAALSSRLAYAMMCLSLTWGVLTSMGWVSRLANRGAMRSGHMILSTMTLSFIAMHVLSYTLLAQSPWTFDQLLIPFSSGGKFRHAMGTLAFEGMLVAALAIGLRRFMSYWRWLWIHRLAYPAFGFGVVHAFMGAMENGHLSALWIGGITLLVPAVTVTLLRLLPAKALTTTGLLEEVP